ncbi:membrane protein [Bacillus sp. V3-13]|uniref:YitT family protein n=1 Tax=Bacillus sp. V3-13 TaxID=2053728 RepID=UPI000C7949D2|nr:YitT family protein [Bacillus sp. V3-13]PLR78726.1 membrane protein [Bacillus sp. V3-13]
MVLSKGNNRSLGSIFFRQVLTYGYLTCGGIIQGLGMALFLFPNSIPSGGAAGLAVLLNFFLEISLGLALWFSNLIALSLAVKYFGCEWTFRTMYSVSITSFTVNWVTAFWYLPDLNIGLDILLGAILYGIGVGILIRYGSSSGGMVVIALIIAMQKNWSPGKAMFWVNLSIFILTALVIDLKIVLFAIICQFLSAKIIDFVDNYKIEFTLFQEPGWRRK